MEIYNKYSNLILFPDVVINSHFPPSALLSPPLFRLAADVRELLIGQLQVIRLEELILFAMETPVNIQQAAIVVQSTEVIYEASQ